jgi:hypothetical protein
MTDVYGDWIHPKQVEQAVLATIEHWIENYLREAEYQFSWNGEAPLPRSYRRVNDFDPIGVEQLPLIMAISPGLTDRPSMEGDGSFTFTWAVGVGILVSARTFEETRDLAGLYVTAVRALLLQNGSLGGFADGTYLLDERYDDAPSDMSRTMGSAQVMFEVQVSNVVNRRRGPKALPMAPGTEHGRVETVHVEVDRKE